MTLVACILLSTSLYSFEANAITNEGYQQVAAYEGKCYTTNWSCYHDDAYFDTFENNQVRIKITSISSSHNTTITYQITNKGNKFLKFVSLQCYPSTLTEEGFCVPAAHSLRDSYGNRYKLTSVKPATGELSILPNQTLDITTTFREPLVTPGEYAYFTIRPENIDATKRTGKVSGYDPIIFIIKLGGWDPKKLDDWKQKWDTNAR